MGFPESLGPGLGVVCETRSYETQWSGVAPDIQLPVILFQECSVEKNTLMCPVLAQVESRLSANRKTVKLVLKNHNCEQA